MGESVSWRGFETRTDGGEHFDNRRKCTVRELKDIELVGLAPDSKGLPAKGRSAKGRAAKNKSSLEQELEGELPNFAT
jgi:hypothetical protein